MIRRFFLVVLFAGVALVFGTNVLAESPTPTGDSDKNLKERSHVKRSSDKGSQRLVVNRGGKQLERSVRTDDAVRLMASRKDTSSGTTATLRVKSQPSGARIKLNGRYRGQTPWSGRVEADTQTLRLQKNGFQSWQLKLVPTRSMSLVGILEEEADVDTRVIRSSSRGVRNVTDRTSVSSEVFRRVIPPPEGPSEPDRSDTPAQETRDERPQGSIPLEIESSPPGAMVEVDGRKLGRTPVLREQFQEGTVTITLTKSGYQAWEERIDLTQPTRMKVKLRQK